jgi:hypothetical protein
MSTYSTNLALELIGTGEQAGTWGVTTNTNLGTLLEQAISGYVTQAITDGADTTITIPNGATGVARNIFIEMTGALTATRNLIVPANKKLYFIYNNTTGGFAVTVKVSGQTGVSVPNGKKVILVSNGTDIVNAENYIASLSVGALTSGRVPYASTAGLLVDSANLTFNGTTLTAAGFSGPISGVVTSTSITDSGLTSGRVTYATTGGLLTDSANLTFSGSALAVTGTLSATDAQIGYTGVNVPNGSNNQGLYIPTYNIGLAGVYSSINWPTTSASPSTSAWWMFGRAGSDNVTQLKIRRNTGVDVSAYIVNASGTDAAKIVDNHQWYTSGSQAMTLDSSGNVGIGTSSPSCRLDLGSSYVVSPTLTAADVKLAVTSVSSTEKYGFYVDNAGSLVSLSGSNTLGGIFKWVSTAVERMRLDSSGNLLVGTTSQYASSKLSVLGSGAFNTGGVDGTFTSFINAVYTGNTAQFASIQHSMSSNSVSSGFRFLGGGAGGGGTTQQKMYDMTRGQHVWFVTDSEVARIDSSGNLLVGTTSATSGGKVVSNGIVYQLQTANGTSGTPVLSGGYLIGPNDSTIYAGIRALNSYLSNNASQLAFYVTATSGSAYEAGRFDSSGNLGIGVTPNAWVGYRAIQFPNGGSISGYNGSVSPILELSSNQYYDGAYKYVITGVATRYAQNQGVHSWYNAASGTAGNTISFTQAMTLDASGNLGIGTTSPACKLEIATTEQSIKITGSGASNFLTIANTSRSFNFGVDTTGFNVYDNTAGSYRLNINSSGNLSYGSWGLVVQDFSTQMSVGTGDVGLCFVANSGQKRIIPRQPNSIGSASDNLIDLGDSGSRFRTIYAGTGTINTSDRNEKQDIQDLSEVEKRIAVKIKSLIKTFRFKDVIAEKGDIARIHTGVIAQEIRDAFTSEGLDAHRYALFCSDTWIDDETNTEITRLGIRYDELLSFVIAAL